MSARAAGSTTWHARLSDQQRSTLRELFRPSPLRRSVALAYPAIWAAAYAAMLAWPILPVRIAGYATIGATIHALGILMHEAAHRNLFRNRRLDGLAAFLLGAPVFISGEAYRVSHLLHHRNTRGPEDPDEFGAHLSHPTVLSIAFYVWGLVGMLVGLVHAPRTALKQGGRRERRRIVVEYAALVLLYSVVAWLAVRAGGARHLVHAWLLPLVFTLLIGNVRGWAEHMMTVPGDPLTESRTVTSNALVRFFMCNVNFHLEHHLCPGVPWYNLPRLHALLQPQYRQAGAFVYRSYVRFLLDALRGGIHGLAPDPAVRPDPRRTGPTGSPT